MILKRKKIFVAEASIAVVLAGYAALVALAAYSGLSENLSFSTLPTMEAFRQLTAGISILFFGSAAFVGLVYALYMIASMLYDEKHAINQHGETMIAQFVTRWMTSWDSLPPRRGTMFLLKHVAIMTLSGLIMVWATLQHYNSLTPWQFMFSLAMFLPAFVWIVCQGMREWMRGKS